MSQWAIASNWRSMCSMKSKKSAVKSKWARHRGSKVSRDQQCLILRRSSRIAKLRLSLFLSKGRKIWNLMTKQKNLWERLSNNSWSSRSYKPFGPSTGLAIWSPIIRSSNMSIGVLRSIKWRGSTHTLKATQRKRSLRRCFMFLLTC